MKTLEEIKDEVVKKYGFKNFDAFIVDQNDNYSISYIDEVINEIAKLYANAKLEESAECANLRRFCMNSHKTDNVDGITIGACNYTVNKQSILNLKDKV